MPYRDPDRQRQAKREWARRRRAGDPTRQPALPAETRLRTAQDVLGLLERTIASVEAENTDTLAKARVIVSAAGVLLKAVEVVGLEERLKALEETVGERRVVPFRNVG